MALDAPDYFRNVYRAGIYALYKPKGDEATVELARVMSDEASLFSFVKPVLPSGEVVHLIDTTTGTDTPYTVPAGYQMTVLMTWYSFNGPCEIRLKIDGYLYAQAYPSTPGIWYENDVITFQISLIDPTYALPHTIDATLKNLGADDLMGEGVLGLVLQSMGTPPMPKTKLVQCRGCGDLVEVPEEATIHICPVCKTVTRYYAFKAPRKEVK